MSDHITPDKARKLLDGTTPGPWQSRGDGPSSGKPYLRVCTCDDRTHVAESVSWDNAPLIAAAPALAELVAGLRYEYAAQVRRGSASPWLYVLQNGHFSKRGSTSVWCKKKRGCQNAIRSALKRKDVGADTVEFRVVRRLVGEPEVVE